MSMPMSIYFLQGRVKKKMMSIHTLMKLAELREKILS